MLGYACARLPIAWTPARLLLLPLTILSGAAIFTGLVIVGATVCFWTIRTPEVINVFTVGGSEASSYPLSIYSGWEPQHLPVRPSQSRSPTIRPRCCCSAAPTRTACRPGTAWLAPLAAALFCAIALAFWQIGVSKCTSAGS